MPGAGAGGSHRPGRRKPRRRGRPRLCVASPLNAGAGAACQGGCELAAVPPSRTHSLEAGAGGPQPALGPRVLQPRGGRCVHPLRGERAGSGPCEEAGAAGAEVLAAPRQPSLLARLGHLISVVSLCMMFPLNPKCREGWWRGGVEMAPESAGKGLPDPKPRSVWEFPGKVPAAPRGHGS